MRSLGVEIGVRRCSRSSEQRVPQGSVIKCLALYSQPFWRDERPTGQATSATGPVKFTYDVSPPDGKPGILVGYLEGEHARRLGRISPAERRQAVLGCLGSYLRSGPIRGTGGGGGARRVGAREPARSRP